MNARLQQLIEQRNLADAHRKRVEEEAAHAEAAEQRRAWVTAERHYAETLEAVKLARAALQPLIAAANDPLLAIKQAGADASALDAELATRAKVLEARRLHCANVLVEARQLLDEANAQLLAPGGVAAARDLAAKAVERDPELALAALELQLLADETRVEPAVGNWLAMAGVGLIMLTLVVLLVVHLQRNWILLSL